VGSTNNARAKEMRTADFCPFCQQHFPEYSGHNESDLHLKNVKIMQAWERSDQQLHFCTDMLQGMDFVREGLYDADVVPEEVIAPKEASDLGEAFAPEEATVETEVAIESIESVEQAQEIDEDGFIQVTRKTKRLKRMNHLNCKAGQR
jgi:hypothetical protein